MLVLHAGEKSKAGKRNKEFWGVGGAEGGVALLDRVARRDLPEKVMLIKHLKEVSEGTMWPFGKEHSRQREEHVQRP